MLWPEDVALPHKQICRLSGFSHDSTRPDSAVTRSIEAVKLKDQMDEYEHYICAS